MYIPKDIIKLRVVLDVNGAMDINMSNNKVVNVADPIGPHDAATKCYTDHLIDNIHNLTPLPDEVELNILIISINEIQHYIVWQGY